MPVVRVDEDVWNWLKSHATPLEDTPNSVLRRLAGLDLAVSALTKVSKDKTRRKRSANHAEATAQGNGDYVVSKRADRYEHWWFQIYQRKLAQKSRRGDFSVVVICDSQASSETVFRVPYAYLRDHILSKAKLESDTIHVRGS